ncbi:hypothetical protein MRX96_021823 [Rhipicephalus microplus]
MTPLNWVTEFISFFLGAVSSYIHTLGRKIAWWPSSWHFLNSKLFPLPELATANEPMIKEFDRQQLQGDHCKHHYSELQHRHHCQVHDGLCLRPGQDLWGTVKGRMIGCSSSSHLLE